MKSEKDKALEQVLADIEKQQKKEHKTKVKKVKINTIEIIKLDFLITIINTKKC